MPIEELAGDIDVEEIYRFIDALVLEYTKTLPADRRRLAERFKLSRLARKVVGVGSVGTETWALLMEPDDGLAGCRFSAGIAAVDEFELVSSQELSARQRLRFVCTRRLASYAERDFESRIAVGTFRAVYRKIWPPGRSGLQS